MTIEEDEKKNGEGEWYSDILQYLKDGTYPKFADKNDQLTSGCCLLITLFVVKDFTEDHMMEFNSFV